jgi:hypothetical protein
MSDEKQKQTQEHTTEEDLKEITTTDKDEKVADYKKAD